MATACYLNSRKLYLDSLSLCSRKSAGHAYSLLVLSIEESVKAIIYRLAADGLVRFSEKGKDDPTAVNEEDLLDHKIKHKILVGIIAASITYAPFVNAFEGYHKKRIAVTKARDIMTNAIVQHQVLMANLSDPKSAASRTVTKFFEFAENLNREKNLGFYVGRKESVVLMPNRISRSKYEYWRGFQEVFLEGTKSIVDNGIGNVPLEMFKKSQRSIARRLKKKQFSEPIA